MHYVNVGQGDGTIWQLPGGGVVVYDCGLPASSSATNPVTTYLRTVLSLAAGSHIHALIASHGHLDHIGGCEEVLQDYVVDHVYDTWYLNTNNDEPQSYATFKAQVRSEGAIVHNLQDDPALANDVRFHQWDLIPLPASAVGVQAQIIWPPAPASTWSNIPEASLAVRLTYGSMDYCFQGDIETPQETTLANDPHGLDCEVFLMGHHGSRYASSSAWLARMDPEYAPVSFGQNSYGHPTAEALCRIQSAGAAVYATQRLGSIVIETDGSQVTVTPNQPEATNYCAAGADYWTGSGTPATTPPPLEIVTVVNPAGSALDEYVEVKNNGNTPAAMQDYTVNDQAGTTYTFPAFTLPAGASVRVHTGSGTATATDLYWGRGSAVWNNSGDTAYLRDPTGSLVDDYTY